MNVAKYNLNHSQNRKCFACQDKCKAFTKLDYTELHLASENKVHLHFRKGETIAKQGAFVTHVMYLLTGLVKVYKEVDDKTAPIYDIYAKGKLLGLDTLFELDKYPYSIAAVEDSHICAIDKKVIEKLIHNNGTFAAEILKSVNTDIFNNREKMVSLTVKQLYGRLADTLLYLSDDVYEGEEFELNLSRKELGDLSGMSKMSVVRTIQDFIKDGLIENHDHTIRIKDKQALASLSING